MSVVSHAKGMSLQFGESIVILELLKFMHWTIGAGAEKSALGKINFERSVKMTYLCENNL